MIGFDLGRITTNILNSIDNVAKETLEEPQISATTLRRKKKAEVKYIVIFLLLFYDGFYIVAR